MTEKELARDTAVMTVSSLLSQSVDVGFDLWLTARLGAAKAGLLRLTETVFSTGITFSCAGTRLAGSRLTAELAAQGKATGSAARLLIFYALGVSCTAAAVMYNCSGFIASAWIGNALAAGVLRVFALSLPLIALNCVMSGRFTALGLASPYSGILFAEGLFRVCAAVLMIKSLPPGGEMLSAARAKFGSEIFSLAAASALAVYAAKREKGHTDEKPTLKKLLGIALPDLFGASARSLLLSAEHLLIPRSLCRYGASSESALAAYGLIHSIALPVLLWPGALLRSAAELIIPETARKNAAGKSLQVSSAAKRLIHLSSLFSIGSAAVILTFSYPIAHAAGSPDAAGYICLLAPLVPVMFCDMTVDALLRGLNCQMTTMLINLGDSALCLALVVFLLPSAGVKGYIFTLYISEILNFYFGCRKLTKVCTVEFSIRSSVLLPFIRAFFACAPFFACTAKLCRSRALTVLCVCAAAAGYTIMCIFPKSKGSAASGAYQ